jgi:hypothetical protein
MHIELKSAESTDALPSATNEFVKHHKATTGQIIMACDCQSTLHTIFDHNYDHPNEAHYDTIHACRTQRASSPLKCIAKHVSGHQDDHQAYDQLDRWEQINVDMDLLAKQHWTTISDGQRPHFDLPHEDDYNASLPGQINSPSP